MKAEISDKTLSKFRDTLAPCPFCGTGRPKLLRMFHLPQISLSHPERNLHYGWRVECVQCGCSKPHLELDLDKVAKEWNSRWGKDPTIDLFFDQRDDGTIDYQEFRG